MRAWRPTGVFGAWLGRGGRSYREVVVRFREPDGTDPADSLEMVLALEKSARELAPEMARRAKEIALEVRRTHDG